MGERLTIWTNTEDSGEAFELLKSGVGENELVFANERVHVLSAGGYSESLAKAQVAFGQPDANQLMESENLKFVQITSAGYTRYDTPEFKEAIKRKEIAFCNSSSVYADPCAQHLLAFMLASARCVPQAVRAQDQGHGWTFKELRPISRILKGDKVVIVGYGAIGKRLVELLAPFQVEIVSIRRTVKGDEPTPCYPVERLNEFLPNANHVINILPANDANANFFDSARFELFKAGAIFYNIGRGTTVDQAALIESLGSGKVGAALLDVTDPEPLPADHPLWTAPNCTITPHIGGGYIGEERVGVAHFLENLRRFESGQPLNDRVY